MKPFIPIALILISIGLFYLFINPHYQTVRDLFRQRGEYRLALSNIEAVKELRDSLETQYNSLPADDIGRLEKMLPQNINAVKLTADLDAIASRHFMTVRGVRINEQSINDGSAVSGALSKPFETTSMTFNVIGSYPNFLSFLKDMEKSLQLIDVKSLSVKSSGNQANLMQFNVAIQTYWVK